MNIVETLLGMTALGAEWVLWLLLALSVLSIAVMLERLVFFNKIKLDYTSFSQHLINTLNLDNLEAAINLCSKYSANKSPAATVALKGLEQFGSSRETIRGTMTGYIAGIRTSLDQGLVILGTLGNNAPFIGLFGTVIGIIQAFSDLAANPQGGPTVDERHIRSTGRDGCRFTVALPAVITFNFFNKVVRKHLTNTEATIELIMTYASRRTTETSAEKEKNKEINQAP